MATKFGGEKGISKKISQLDWPLGSEQWAARSDRYSAWAAAARGHTTRTSGARGEFKLARQPKRNKTRREREQEPLISVGAPKEEYS